MKGMLYAVRCLKSNEDMILALAGQFKQLSHEPEKFYCCMILAKIFLGFRAISSLHFWHPHFLLQLVLTAYSGTLTQPV